MSGKTKLLMWLLPILAAVVLIAVFWRDLGLLFSRVGTTVVFVLAAFVVGWILGYINARGRYKR